MHDNIWDRYWKNKSNHGWWEQPDPEVIALVKSQSPQTRPTVLDLGCGLGRHTIPFASSGFQVTATDVSGEAILQLHQKVERLRLEITTHVCDVAHQPFPALSFDIILSYNVIYHGMRVHFVSAIDLVWDLLKPCGLFFFTCPTREDGKYGFGNCVAPHTYSAFKSIISGDIHYFTDRDELDHLLNRYIIHSIRKDEGYWTNRGKKQFFSNWYVLTEKPREI
jgi:tellurite methyltransferase